MKWAIAGLCVLGVVAALSAAMLVSALRLSSAANASVPVGEADSPTVPVLCAAQALEPMTVLDGNMVRVKTIPRTEVPAGAMTNPSDVVGKVLSMKMSDGDVFTPLTLTPDSSLKQLATVIPSGKRAVGISVTDYSSLDGMLYPGSTVDVIGSFKVGDADHPEKPELIASTTLLENVQVLAIEQQTIVSPPKSLTDNLDSSNHTTGMRRVTLLVDSRQAKSLELAMQKGTLSLALRNPLDANHGDASDVWEETLLHEVPKIPAVGPTSAPSEPEKVEVPTGPHWDVQVIRGDAVETVTFPMNHQPTGFAGK